MTYLAYVGNYDYSLTDDTKDQTHILGQSCTQRF